jgi:hypothetical protein
MEKNNIIIDVAVIAQNTSAIKKQFDNSHIINLDAINISEELFKNIFYPHGNTFGLDKKYCTKEGVIPYISFLPNYRSVDGKKFYLLEEILSNLEKDLNVSRNCFTTDSLVELTNELIDIKSLCNINCCSLLSSLTWENINDIIKNYKLLQDSQDINMKVVPICVVSIIFKTPTEGVEDTIVKFSYKIMNMER